jgi:hypothetical protein
MAAPDPMPARARTLERAIRAFLAFWSTPYPGADVDPTATTASAASSAAVTFVAATGHNAELGAAMIAHTTQDSVLAAAYNAIGGAVPAGFGADWDAYTASFMTIPFLNASVTGHRMFLERLARAEAHLVAQHGDQIRSRVNPSGSMSQLREFEDSARLSYHHLGLAVDVSGAANPWIGEGRGGGHETRAAVSAIVTWYAAWLTGHGTPMSSVAASEAGFGNADTGAVWDRLHAASDATREYFALASDRSALAARIAALGTAPAEPAGFAQVPEAPAGTTLTTATGWSELATVSRTADADHWATMIAAQQHAWEANVHTRDGSFMSLERELVIALRDVGGLAWGACDFGAHSASAGDFMHFDMRTVFPYATFERFRRALRDGGH